MVTKDVLDPTVLCISVSISRGIACIHCRLVFDLTTMLMEIISRLSYDEHC